jgi:hypothetical protein
VKAILTGVLAVLMLLALASGCEALGVPGEWCGLSAAALWAMGVLGLTVIWAPRPVPK